MKNAKIDTSIAKMPRMMDTNTFIRFFNEKPSNDITSDFGSNDIKDRPCNYNTVSYFISGLGIFIAKILGGSIADIYITGRIFNLIGYIAITILALKVLPYKKNVFYVISFMPMILALSAIYSPDGIVLAISILFLAYCFKLKEKKENYTLKEILILLLLMVLVALAKSVGYIGLLLCVFILPFKTMYKEHKKFFKYMFGILIIFSLIIITMFYNAINTDGDPRVQNTDTRAQFKYVMESPFKYCGLLFKDFIITFTSLKGMSFLNAPMFFRQTYFINYIWLILYLLIISVADSSKHFNMKGKALFCLSFIIVYATISTAMYLSYTPVGANYIGGYQMRYNFPILGLILICLSSKKMNLKNGGKYSIYINYPISIFLMISILDVVVNLV